MRTTIQLDPHLLKAAKKYAADNRRTLTAVIEGALRDVLARSQAPRPAVHLPISTRTGGFQPGVDLNRMADVYEMFDQEDLERSRGSR